MKKTAFLPLSIAIVLSISCNSDNDNNLSKVTMLTNKTGEVVVFMAGKGSVTIDWGDKTAKETHILFDPFYGTHDYSHTYSDSISHVITLTGENITQLECEKIRLTNLDVSKNVALTHLWCSSNQLTSLDLSKNKALTFLDCGANQLTSLDISNNTSLTQLWCPFNQLTGLDISNNTALTTLSYPRNKIKDLDLSKKHCADIFALRR